MQYFIVADVHSFYNEMIKSLEENGWENRDDQCFVSLGDLCDRGPDTVKCLQFVNALPDNRKILIRGNHEDLMELAICRHIFYAHDIHNGTVKSAEHIATHEGVAIKEHGLSEEDDMEILEAVKNSELWNNYIKSTVNFSEVGNNIFVHGWIPCERVIEEDSMGFLRTVEYKKKDKWRSDASNWAEARWINGMEAWSLGAKIQGKTIWCGHWHTSWGHAHLHHEGVEFPKNGEKAHFSPFVDKGIVAIDACTAFSNKVNCKVLEV